MHKHLLWRACQHSSSEAAFVLSKFHVFDFCGTRHPSIRINISICILLVCRLALPQTLISYNCYLKCQASSLVLHPPSNNLFQFLLVIMSMSKAAPLSPQYAMSHSFKGQTFPTHKRFPANKWSYTCQALSCHLQLTCNHVWPGLFSEPSPFTRYAFYLADPERYLRIGFF